MNSNTPQPPDDGDPRLSDEVTRKLRTTFRADAALLPAPSGPAAAVSRARSRRRNRHRALASAAALAILGASTYVLAADGGKQELSTAAQEAVLDESLGFDWTVTDDGLMSYVDTSWAGDSGLYAVSTAPGTSADDFPEGGAPRATYQLADDGSWVPTLIEGDRPGIGRVSERGGTLYALSTGTADSQDGKPRGSISTDGGETWSTVPLQQVAPPSDAVPWTLSYTVDIASTADTTVALVAAVVSLPYETLFPELYEEGEGDVFYTTVETATGIDLVREDPDEARQREQASAEGRKAEESGETATTGPPTSMALDGSTAEVVRTVTWDSLGITGPDDMGGQLWAYVVEGDAWTEVPAPALSDDAHGDQLTLKATPDTFVLSAGEFQEDGSQVVSSYRSTDGQTWEALDLPGDGTHSGQLHTVGDSLVVVGPNYEQQGTLMIGSGDGNWSPIDVSGLDPALGLDPKGWLDASSGPLGLALVAYAPEGEKTFLLFSSDLEHWSITDLGDVAPEGIRAGHVIVGNDRVVVLGGGLVGPKGSPENSATMVGVPRRR